MTINNIIVEIDKTYQNEVDGITVNSTIESVFHITRMATVIDAPSYVSVKRGDKVVCHHNVFREKRNMKGKKLKSDYHLSGNQYFVPFELVFAYIRNGEWVSLSPFCFIKPIKKELESVDGILLNADDSNSYKKRVSNEGVVVHPNKELLEMGINIGDKVAFKPFTRYEFNINNELLYKMSTTDIVAKL